MYLSLENIEAFQAIEQELSNTEAALAELACEPFAKHPGPDGSDQEIRVWIATQERRSERLTLLVSRHQMLMRLQRDMLGSERPE